MPTIRSSAIAATPSADVLAARCGATVYGDGGYIALKVATRYDVAEDFTTCREAVATQDGRRANLCEWHRGPSTDVVFYECHTVAGRASHGFIDAASRKLVQVG